MSARTFDFSAYVDPCYHVPRPSTKKAAPVIIDSDDDFVRVRSTAPELSRCRALILSPQPLKTGKTRKKTPVQGTRTSPRFGRRSTQ